MIGVINFKKKDMTKDDKVLDFLFSDIQRQIRWLRLGLAAAEKSTIELEKLIKDN